MNNAEFWVIVALAFSYIIGNVVTTYLTIKNGNERIKADMALAEAQSKAMTAKPFKELKEFLDGMIDLYLANEIVLALSGTFTLDERNDLLIEYTASISKLVYTSLSSEFKRQLAYYVEISPDIVKPDDEDYLTYYIRKTVMLKLTVIIDSRMKVIEQSKEAEKKQQ